MPRISFRNFTGGEVTPTLSARYDLKKSGSFLQCCQNFIPNLHGDIERRPGMMFLADLGTFSVAIPFQFNTDPKNNYVLLFGEDKKIRIAQESGLSDVVLDSPYSVADVYQISYAQVADVLYLAHSGYPLYKIMRSGEAGQYEWTMQQVVLNKSLEAPEGVTAQFVRGNAEDTAELQYTLRYKVTAVSEDGVESVASPVGEALGKYPTDWVVGNHVDISWTAVDGAFEYNIYRESAGYYGFIGVADGTTFSDQNFEPETSVTPKEDWNPFADGNNPATVCFHGQRMWLGGGTLHPATVYASRVGDFESFRKSKPLQDDDPLEYMLASGSVDDICWLTSFNDLMIGTSGGEYKATSSGAAITPSDCQISVQSYWGSSDVQPLIIGQSILHCQRADTHVRDLYYSWESDGYAGNDLSILAPQLVERHKILQWCFQQSPSSCVWAVRDDGVLLCLTYMKEQNVFGWSRHVTEGRVCSVSVVNGKREDVVLLVVEREIEGEKRYYLERLAPRFKNTSKIDEAFFVDCGVRIENKIATRIASSPVLSIIEGKDVVALADGRYVSGLTVQTNRVLLPFTAKKVLIGLPYVSVLTPMPADTDNNDGSTLGKRRAYGRCVVRVYRSWGGQYAASRPFALYDARAWENLDRYDIPIISGLLPDGNDRGGEADEFWGITIPGQDNEGEEEWSWDSDSLRLFSGDIEFVLPSGQDEDTTIWLVHDKPYPFRLVSIMAEVDFGEQ